MKFFLVLVVIFFQGLSGAQNSKLVIQVLFEVQKQAFTTYDFKNYLKVKQELKAEHLLGLVQNELEEFILFQLVDLEVKNLDFQLPEDDKNKKISAEHRQFLLVQNYLKLKEKHFGQIDRYTSWTDILKRKYNYLAKIDELKKH
jgi:hypothetical protein